MLYHGSHITKTQKAEDLHLHLKTTQSEFGILSVIQYFIQSQVIRLVFRKCYGLEMDIYIQLLKIALSRYEMLKMEDVLENSKATLTGLINFLPVLISYSELAFLIHLLKRNQRQMPKSCKSPEKDTLKSRVEVKDWSLVLMTLR